MRYCLDTSAILAAWRRNYPPDVFPSVWANIDAVIEQGDVVAPDEVLFELEKKDDEVYEWARQRDAMFIPIDGNIQQVVRGILSQYPRLLDTRRNRSGADPFVIALARIEGCIVVTSEGPSNSSLRPHIPDVCQALGVPWIDLVEMARQQAWRI